MIITTLPKVLTGFCKNAREIKNCCFNSKTKISNSLDTHGLVLFFPK